MEGKCAGRYLYGTSLYRLIMRAGKIYYTLNQLYHQRTILFAIIVNDNIEISWKSHRDANGNLWFAGSWFIVGIDTPKGIFSLLLENKHWDLFDCKEIECGKPLDEQTDKDIDRLLSIKNHLF